MRPRFVVRLVVAASLFGFAGCASFDMHNSFAGRDGDDKQTPQDSETRLAKARLLAENGDVDAAMQLMGGVEPDHDDSEQKTPPRTSRFSWWPNRRTEANEASAASKSENPFQPSEKRQNANASPPASRHPQGQGDFLAALDPETHQLVQEELQRLPFAEREDLIADLSQISDPAMLRLIVKNRRMVRQMGQNVRDTGLGAETTRKDAMPAVASTDSVREPVGGFGHSGLSAPNPRVAAEFTGLGAESPWSQRRTDRDTSSIQLAGQNRTALPTATQGFGAASGSEDRSRIESDGPQGNGFGPQTSPSDPVAQTSLRPATPSNPALPLPNAKIDAVLEQNPNATALPEIAQDHASRANAKASVTQRVQDAFLEFVGQTERAQPANAEVPQSAMGSSWQETLQQLIALTEANLAGLTPGETEEERRNYIQSHVFLRVLYLMAGRDEQRAMQPIPHLDSADREFWQQMIFAMWNYFDLQGMPNSTERAAQTIAQLRSAIHRLQDNARLELKNVAFCRKISSFGDYEKFDPYEFTHGQPVLLYAEVGNFKSELNAGNKFRTVLKSAIEIHKPGADGGLLKRIEFGATEDACLNVRRDYFHSYTFEIPKGLPIGPHVLKLTVEDQLSNKIATDSLNFTVR